VGVELRQTNLLLLILDSDKLLVAEGVLLVDHDLLVEAVVSQHAVRKR
jgi:hypothetical protein